ncbi:AMP-binding protein [Pseudoxanthomonas sp.]|uniref:AMP-dependent synthetase/ligase n=1 Tax=Pseudoxanthomonas sp. TaxID=1871049 RepID=UPI002639B051|nr:AMP-binding protein [Pseudoxanthomonas sp.]WDS36943.1 MAG: AMP-binding protein [Pseudoxanthomonas sp.]
MDTHAGRSVGSELEDPQLALPSALRGQTMARLFWARCAERGNKIALRRTRNGHRRQVSWREYGDNARLTGVGLLSLDVGGQDVVSILAEGCPEWLYADFGTQGIGAICNGIYTTSSAEQVAHVLRDSATVLCIVDERKQLDKVLAIRDECPSLRWIIVIDPAALEGIDDPMVVSFIDLLAMGRRFDLEHPGFWEERLASGRHEDIAMLVYTSGTTGPPKGAMLTNTSLIFLMETEPSVMAQGPDDEFLNFLPLCHTAGRLLSAIFPVRSACGVTFVERADTLAAEMKELQPSLFFAPPRLWSKIHAGVEASMVKASASRRLAYGLAFSVGYRRARWLVAHRPPPLWINLLYGLADRLVFRGLKHSVGLGRCTSPLTGAAPIPSEVVNWYVALGIELREAYGQTEATGLIATTPDGSYKVGTAGRPLPHTKVRLGDRDEILVQGPNVFKGYYNQPEKSKETLADGWLKTGDVGRFDGDGWLYIVDRLSDIIITDGGKNISPTEIENKLKAAPYIADAIVIGDRRPYLTGLIVIDFESVAQHAREKHFALADFASLSQAPEVVALIERSVTTVNQQLSRVETVKRFRLIDRQPTIEHGDLTATGKLKRSIFTQKYSALIDDMYAGKQDEPGAQ